MAFEFQFRPRLWQQVRSGYRMDDFRADLSAGVTVGIVALPLAMAFGIASGVKPEQGIFTAIIAGLLISLLGGSRVQIGGPAGAFVALLYAIVEKYGVANLLIAVFMSGVLLFAMGALKLGNLIRYIPISIVIGFTSGIAVIIGMQQVKDFFGLSIAKMPANFFSQLAAIWQAIETVNWVTVAVGMGSLVILIVWPREKARPVAGESAGVWSARLSKVPGTIIVLALGVLLVSVTDLGLETIGSRFGGIPRSLPPLEAPHFDWQTAQNLVTPTISIALLCAIESLLCARVADGMIDDRHDPNQELMAQGVANFVTPFFGGIAATGTIARTVTNVRAGARSPVAGIVHALTLLAVVLLLAPLASNIPMASLAAILLYVAYNMGDWREFRRLRQFSNNYRIIMLSTFLLTVIFDVTVAVEIGLVLASLFFIYRISSLTRLDSVRIPGGLARRPDGRRVAAYRLFGSLFFGSVSRLEHLLDARHELPDVLVLEFHQLINLDTTGLDALESLMLTLRKRGGRLILAGVNEQPLSLMRRSGFLAELGEENLLGDLEAALRVAETA